LAGKAFIFRTFKYALCFSHITYNIFLIYTGKNILLITRPFYIYRRLKYYLCAYSANKRTLNPFNKFFYTSFFTVWQEYFSIKRWSIKKVEAKKTTTRNQCIGLVLDPPQEPQQLSMKPACGNCTLSALSRYKSYNTYTLVYYIYVGQKRLRRSKAFTSVKSYT